MSARFLKAAAFSAVALPFCISAVLAADDNTTNPPGSPDQVTPDQVTVTAQRLNAARDTIQPSLGASVYNFSRMDIEDQPGGDQQEFDKVLLQAPSVAQDSYGQLHVRGEHANLQYRINGVELPEGIDVFGQAIETRLADSVSLITGSLPAEYGFRTSGVIDINTKSGALDPGGVVGFYGGGHDTIQPHAEYGGSSGNFDYFVASDYLQNNLGIENPVSSPGAVHDNTQQGKGFAYMSDTINSETRASVIFGTVQSQFQIPNNPGQAPMLGLNVNGVTSANSALTNENQREITDFGIATLQKSLDAVDYQVSLFSRYSSVYYQPDPLADILFTGIAQQASRESMANGIQTDGSDKLNDQHTLRTGFLFQTERAANSTANSVLPEQDGVQVSDQPETIDDTAHRIGFLYGAYVQDEWKALEDLTINYGGRYDAVDEYAHGDQFSPRFNTVYQATPTTTMHAGYSRYFTPPSFELVGNDVLSKVANSSAEPQVTLDNTPKPERANYYDIGLEQVVAKGLTVTLDSYYKQFLQHD